MKPIAIDTETALIQTGNWWPSLACITACEPGGDPLFLSFDEFREVLEDPDYLIVGHNVAYDMGVLWRYDPSIGDALFGAFASNRITDTLIRQKLSDLRTGHFSEVKSYSLDALAQRVLDLPPMDKSTHRLGFGELIGVPVEQWPDGAAEYALGDALVTIELFGAQEGSDGLTDQYRQTFSAFALACLSWRGMVTDPVMVARLRARYEDDYEHARQRCIDDHGFFRETRKGLVKDTKAIRRAMIEECDSTGVTVPRTAGYDPDSDKTVDPLWGVRVDREALAAVESESLRDYAIVSQYRAILDDHLPSLERGLIHPDFNPLVATGRTSCRKSKIVNGYQTQNIRREPGIRECFRARPGYLFASADFAMLELHTLAQTCIDWFGESRLADALNRGVDVHLWLAAGILGKPYESLDKKDPEVKEARTFAKIGNFGFPGGMGVESFRLWAKKSYGAVLTLDQVQDLRDNWFQTWPEMAYFFREINRQCDEGGGLATVHFERPDRYRAGCHYTAACNAYFQGPGSDAAKAALREVVTECFVDLGTGLYGSYPVNFIHDEIIIEAPEGSAEDAAHRLAEVMISAGTEWVPDVPLRAEPTLMTHWSKNAEGMEKVWTPDTE